MTKAILNILLLFALDQRVIRSLDTLCVDLQVAIIGHQSIAFCLYVSDFSIYGCRHTNSAAATGTCSTARWRTLESLEHPLLANNACGELL